MDTNENKKQIQVRLTISADCPDGYLSDIINVDKDISETELDEYAREFMYDHVDYYWVKLDDKGNEIEE